MSDNKSATSDILAFLKPIWGGISFILGLITALLGFIKLAKGDLGLFTLTLLVVGILALWLTCVYYVWFWKPERDDPSSSSPQFWRRFLRPFQVTPSPEENQ